MKMEQGYDIFTSPLPSSCESSFSVLPEYLQTIVILRSTLFLCQYHGRGLRRQLGWCHPANPDFAFFPSVTDPAPARLNGLQTTA